ncbi:MAG TPA: hypothetical protein VFI42_04885 [Thermomicrobiaceae bacterium]|nr:hypothetical protein [Thermomicrobiaceae bacterium]
MLLARALGWFAGMTPRALGYWFAERAADLLRLILPTYRKNVAANLSRVLGVAADDAAIAPLSREVFRTSARNFFDLLSLPHVSDARLHRAVRVAPESWERLDRALSLGRGALAVTAHFGAFDYVGQLVAMEGYNVTALTTRTVPEFIYSTVTHLRSCRGMALAEATPGGVRRALLAVRRGGVVVLLADRDFHQSGEPIDFFGRPTTLPVGPARLARDTGAPILLMFTRRRGLGYDFVLEEPFTVERTEDAARDIRVAMGRIVAHFEQVIRADPAQWVMFQEVWPSEPPAALRVFPIGSPMAGKLLGHGADLARPLTEPAVAADEPEPSAPPVESRSRQRAREPSDS